MNPALRPAGRYPVGSVYPPTSGVGYPAHGRSSSAQYYAGHAPASRYLADADPYLDRYGSRTPNPYGPSYGRSRTPGAEWGQEYPGRRTWSYDDRMPRSRGGGVDELGRPIALGDYPNRDGYYDPLNEMDRHYGGSAWHGHGKRYSGRDGPYEEYYGNERDGYMNRPGGSIHETTEYISGPDHMRRRYSGGEALFDRAGTHGRGRYPSSHIPPGVDTYIEDEIYDEANSGMWGRGRGHREHRSSRGYGGEHRGRSSSVDPRLQQPAGYIDAPPGEFPDDIVPIASRAGSEYSTHSRPGSRSGYGSSTTVQNRVPLAPRGGARFGSRAQSPFTPSRHREYREGDEGYLSESDEDIEP
ncbi:hypothetical protein BDQ17DRAFT_1352139 [Cyathus striatus]|nr:hypothetical protein BDQ17DRAFT_1352139 [Cyathus striatus]